MTASDPLISILMPYYNFDEFFAEAVQSVRVQTYQNWELVVVDDGSPNCPASRVLDTIVDSRISLFREQTNRGIGATRNAAASYSKGQFLLPLDTDDLLAPTYIERTLKAMAEADASFAYTDVKIFGQFEKIHTPSIDLGEIFTGHFPHNTFLIKRETFDALGGYNTECLIEDTEFWISAIEAGTKFAYVPEPLFFYRRHENSVSGQRGGELVKDFLAVMSKHHTSAAKHLPKILEGWLQIEERQMEHKIAKINMDTELAHIEKEFTLLKKRYEHLESKVARNEKILASIPQLTRQLLFLATKRNANTPTNTAHK